MERFEVSRVINLEHLRRYPAKVIPWLGRQLGEDAPPELRARLEGVLADLAEVIAAIPRYAIDGR